MTAYIQYVFQLEDFMCKEKKKRNNLVSYNYEGVFCEPLSTFLLCIRACSVTSKLSVTPCIVACQAPLSMVFSRQEYWSGLPYPPPGDLPNLGIKPASLMSPALTGGFFTTSATWVLANIMYSPIFSHFLCLLMNS